MIDDTLYALTDFEQWLKNMQLNVDSKQSTRIFSNSVWLRDHVETQLKRLEKLRNHLIELKDTATDSTVENNLKISIKYCDDLIKILNTLYQVHKQNVSDSLAHNHWTQTLPSLFGTTTHLRNRLTITQGLLRNTRDQDKHHWLNEL